SCAIRKHRKAGCGSGQPLRVGSRPIGDTRRRERTLWLRSKKALGCASRRQKQGPDLVTLNRKSVEQRGLLVMDGLRDALIFGWRFGPRRPRYGSDLRQSFRRRLGLSGKYTWRCHVGRGCLGSGESLHRIGMPELWQTVALAGEQQCNQRQTYYRKKAESWHFATLRLHRTQYSEKQLSRALATGRVGP